MFDWFKRRNKPSLFLCENADTLMHLGTDSKKRPICLDGTALRRHMLVTGTTGSGKTEFLLGLFSHVFAWNSGGIFVDGKGDMAVYAKMIGMAEYFDRRDDVYVLNFMMGSNGGPGASHCFNPFEKASPERIVQIVVDTVHDESFGIEKMWVGRAVALLTAVVRVLCWLRDERGEYIDIRDLRDSVGLRALINFANPEEYHDMPVAVRQSVKTYLSSLPGYKQSMGYNQSQTTLDQHGYLEMQTTRIFGMMADVYGHIFAAGRSDIDLGDIVNRRRVLLVLLPALEKSKDEITALGRLVVSSLKGMLASRLGATAGADPASQDSKTPPFLCVFDEAPYYLTGGQDLLTAQARALNVGLVFATQDIHALAARSSDSGRGVFANTGVKIVMRNECWHPELDDIFIDAEFGRDDIREALCVRDRDRSFHSARVVSRSLGEGEFLVVNSGRIAFGRGTYVRLEPQRNAVFLTRLKSFTEAAGRLEAARLPKAVPATVDVNGPPPPLPDSVSRFCDEAAGAVGATDLIAAALRGIGTSPAPTTARETLTIGA